MRFYRAERVQELIKRELGEIILREVDLPEGVMATITDVAVDKSLAHAEVRVSVIPSNEKTEKAARLALAKASGYLQRALLKKINIKPMPRIHFSIDRGYENAANVERLLTDDSG